MMKSLTEYMNPDFLTHDSNATSAEWEAGNVALMNMWGSRTGVLMDAEGSTPEVYENTMVGAPMTVGGGTIPASTLWWDGWTVAKNISDEDAVATFLAMKNGISPAILNDETMGQAVWMIDGYQPAPVNDGVFAAMAMGTTPYPMLPYHGPAAHRAGRQPRRLPARQGKRRAGAGRCRSRLYRGCQGKGLPELSR